ncbi:Methyltransferase type 11 [Desulfovibrio sp. X2]|uniref:methyltransferase domain-containing protein n=1 Tax=Desulfovibrio sp. X2 TaxID=941449 RepID=UPI0003587AC0|nr:methyltransferase domain-containing protein [Desulfovibrio sp. X2]EPR41628.1 Methyltransferase type 11 [Desulfovibrio sp. X2]
MRIELLSLLACPDCRFGRLEETLLSGRSAWSGGSPLVLERGARTHDGDVIEGALRCPACGASYPIDDGLAVLLPSSCRASPPPEPGKSGTAGYESEAVLGAYMWSSFGDFAAPARNEDQEPPCGAAPGAAYARWGEMLGPGPSPALDAGCGVGRSTLELAARRGLCVGVELSERFARAARRLLADGSFECSLTEQGRLTRPLKVVLPERLRHVRAEFVVADAMALPFRSGAFACAASLNLLDRLPRPLDHVRELDRVLAARGVELLLADPFSWSEDIAPEERWLGGTALGPFAGRSEDVVPGLLGGEGGHLAAPLAVRGREAVPWTLRTHRNHYENIMSQTFLAER